MARTTYVRTSIFEVLLWCCAIDLYICTEIQSRNSFELSQGVTRLSSSIELGLGDTLRCGAPAAPAGAGANSCEVSRRCTLRCSSDTFTAITIIGFQNDTGLDEATTVEGVEVQGCQRGISLSVTGVSAVSRTLKHTFQLTNTTLRENHTPSGSGSGILVYLDGMLDLTVSLSGSTCAEGNFAYDNGGAAAVILRGGAAANLQIGPEVEFEINSALGYGGGLFVDAGPDSTVHVESRGTIRNNTASNSGGGIHLNAATGSRADIRFTGGALVTRNHAEWNGGGVSVDSTGSSKVAIILADDARVEHNVAFVDGGGLNVETTAAQNSSIHLLHQSRIERNEAHNRGGGIQLTSQSCSGAALFLDGSASIRDNTAGKHGGASRACFLYVFPKQFSPVHSCFVLPQCYSEVASTLTRLVRGMSLFLWVATAVSCGTRQE